MLPLIFESLLTEGQVVTFGGTAYPEGGWAVCLAGGSGSGKGYVRNHFLLLDYIAFDVDDIKRTVVRALQRSDSKLRKHTNQDNYDMSNPEDVSNLHNIVKNNNWLKKKQNAFFDNMTNAPNIIYDVTGDDINKLINNAKTVKTYGYKTSLVWVVTNREEAMVRNVLRDRTVSDDVLHTKHNAINSNLYRFITTSAGQYFDECWIVFGSNAHAGGTDDELQWLNRNRTIQLAKSGDAFIPTTKQSRRIFTTLGPNEPNPSDPQRYVNQQTVKNMVKSKGVKSSTAATTDWSDTKFRKY